MTAKEIQSSAPKDSIFWLREIAYQLALQNERQNTTIRHGVNCHKVIHGTLPGFMHDASDDLSYDVDGIIYCGRCHEAL